MQWHMQVGRAEILDHAKMKLLTPEQDVPGIPRELDNQFFKIQMRNIYYQYSEQKRNWTETWRKEKLQPAGIYMLKVNNKNIRTRCEICSELTIKKPERCQWSCSGVFILNFEQFSHLVLVFLELTLSK